MNSDKIKYLLGVDGGGTKTEFLLTDINKNELRRIFLGGSNPNNSGFKETERILSEGIEKICTDISKGEISLFAGIAGCASEENNCFLRKFLQAFSFGAFSCGGDINNALEAALDGNDGVVIIMGTGIIGFTRKDNTVHRTGGWGYLIDKGGSGFCFGRDALDCALSFYDKRGGSQIISELCEKKLSAPLNVSIPEIYKKGPSEIASFAPTVFEAYRMEDKYAEDIIDSNVLCVSDIIRAASDISQEKKATVIGGLTKEKDVLSVFFRKHLPDYEILFSENKSIDGAIKEASKLIKGEK